MGVLAVRPGSAITASARLTQPSQMYTGGSAITLPISFSTCFCPVPQNEHDRGLPASRTYPLYLGRHPGPFRKNILLFLDRVKT
jgi:hypothetical protein